MSSRGAFTTLWVTSVLLLPACGGGSSVEGGAIHDEVFIETYVDLRATSLRSGDDLTEEARAEVLARHGVTADDLLAFVEAHGTDVEYMKRVWDEVELRLDAARILAEPAADTLPEG